MTEPCVRREEPDEEAADVAEPQDPEDRHGVEVEVAVAHNGLRMDVRIVPA